jgi:thymidylate synthase
MRFDLTEGFPLVTTKKVHLRSIILELLWFLRGDGNARWLQERDVTIWDEWARTTATSARCTACSGARGRRPTAATSTRSPRRRAARRTTELAPHHRQRVERRGAAEMALLPCHAFFQFYVAPPPPARPKLSCQLYQRSADIFLGVPFNIASYALLTHMLAQQCDLDVGDFIWTGGDCHIYSNHAEQVELQLARQPRPYPTLRSPPPGDDLRLRARGFRGRRLRPAPGDQGAGRGLKGAPGGRPRPARPAWRSSLPQRRSLPTGRRAALK